MDFLMDPWTFWMSTKESTLGKGLKDAHSTTTQPVNLFLWEITFRNTLGRKHIIATNVNIKQHSPAILRRTKESTLVKNFTDAPVCEFSTIRFLLNADIIAEQKVSNLPGKNIVRFFTSVNKGVGLQIDSLLNDLSHCRQLYSTPACSCLWQYSICGHAHGKNNKTGVELIRKH